MTLAEAHRQYQDTLEAVRAAHDHADADEADEMRVELMAAMRACENAWFAEVYAR